jgi:hypothetical protein
MIRYVSYYGKKSVLKSGKSAAFNQHPNHFAISSNVLCPVTFLRRSLSCEILRTVRTAC